MHSPTRIYINPRPVPVQRSGTVATEPLAFHQRLPGYTPTPLHVLPVLAARLGIAQLWLKDETQRLGMPAFKLLGAAWAIYTALIERLGPAPAWAKLSDLAPWIAPLQPLCLAAATDGNHGRAVARMAQWLGCSAQIFVPAGTAAARIAAIAAEGAEVFVVDGTYDDAVARSAAAANPHCLVISDTSWPGYEAVPRQVIDGYSTIFAELEAGQLPPHTAPPDVVFVQMGVGALAAAAIGHYQQHATPPRIIGVEPNRAACVLASLEANALTAVPGPHDSIMAGLNCGLPSLIAWPLLQSGLSATLAIDDAYACQAVRELAAVGLRVGETGAAGLGGLLALAAQPELFHQIGLGPHSRVLLIATEGITDPAAHTRLLAVTCQHDCAHQRACVGAVVE
jgi:diaminopropionate ammonia-lyase